MPPLAARPHHRGVEHAFEQEGDKWRGLKRFGCDSFAARQPARQRAAPRRRCMRACDGKEGAVIEKIQLGGGASKPRPARRRKSRAEISARRTSASLGSASWASAPLLRQGVSCSASRPEGSAARRRLVVHSCR
mmetsp:Transcript_27510/g.84919  ORF Transcript_27510/g.84919 Transcript_27510/m.84919 type:complete len:134 (-) Transcript_27510:400-801(-)